MVVALIRFENSLPRPLENGVADRPMMAARQVWRCLGPQARAGSALWQAGAQSRIRGTAAAGADAAGGLDGHVLAGGGQ